MLKIWKHKYTLRRFEKQVDFNGYASSKFRDFTVILDVQPISSQKLNQPEGERTSTKIQSYGEFLVRSADARNGIQGDRLYFNGDWYECDSAVYYEHTPLRHCTATYFKITEAINRDELSAPKVR